MNCRQPQMLVKQYMKYQKEPDEELSGSVKGWSYMRMDTVDLSSSGLLKDLRAGRRNFEGGFQDVADFILRKGLYGVPKAPAHIERPKGYK